ncbi:hypothetical protein [Micromonospora sp. MH99]|uniref:hypothetical protein n=1 Tax=Micromonospora sp. MH99 TaxID=1945510 RepID=UPI001F30CE19|nr:hypothetical protein [Micromonospora sp. MH99]MCF0096114.1 hypothetical protein [Micromonospora sp. MH99]
MTLSAVLLVTAVVWAVSVIRSIRLRALVYSLPLPMTLALVSTPYGVGGAQVLGVLGLNLFFVTVAVTHQRLRWPILLADGAGIAVYVALSTGLLAVDIPFEAALAATLVLWLAAMLLLRRRARTRVTPAAVAGEADAAVGGPGAVGGAGSDAGSGAETSAGGRPDGLPALLKLLVIFVGAILTALLGAVLRGMVVTFPYSGVLVAVEARRQLFEFSGHFARNSLALVGFLTAYHYLQDVSSAVALGTGWAAFAVVAAVLHLPKRRRGAARASPPRRVSRPLRSAVEPPTVR